jgi:hypothetical protein
MSGSFEWVLLDESRDIEWVIVLHWDTDEGPEGDRRYRYVSHIEITSARVMCGTVPNPLAWVAGKTARNALWLEVCDAWKIDPAGFMERYATELQQALEEHLAAKREAAHV